MGKNGVIGLETDVFFRLPAESLDAESERFETCAEKPEGILGAVHDRQAGHHALLENAPGQIAGVDADLEDVHFFGLFERQAGQKPVKQILEPGKKKRRSSLITGTASKLPGFSIVFRDHGRLRSRRGRRPQGAYLVSMGMPKNGKKCSMDGSMMTTAWLFSASGLAVLLVLWAVERAALNRRLHRIPVRIAVTGTRGKSSVVRLIAAALESSGLRVLAKTTGSKPALLFPGGVEKEIRRRGLPSILEARDAVRQASTLNIDVFVCEMMSVREECLRVESLRILRPPILVLTNVRPDHLEAMGRTRDEAARVLSAAFPRGGTVILPEEESGLVFEAAARRRGATLIRAVPLSPAEMSAAPPLPYEEFEVNLRLAASAAARLGLDAAAALKGMARVVPDPGSLRVWALPFGLSGRRIPCVNAFSANEPESTAGILEKLERKEGWAGRARIGLLNLRSDRPDRSLQWAEAFVDGPIRGFSRLFLCGEPARAMQRILKKKGRLPGPQVVRIKGADPASITGELLAAASAEDGIVVGMGNMGGLGRDIAAFWETGGIRL